MYNPHAEKMQRFTESGCVACTSAEEVTELCDTVFLCVKPQIFPEVLRVIAPTVAKKNADDVVIVSIAAGVLKVPFWLPFAPKTFIRFESLSY